MRKNVLSKFSKCELCGSKNRPKAKYCDQCGTKLTDKTASIVAAEEVATGEVATEVEPISSLIEPRNFPGDDICEAEPPDF